jgi:hypothetical protein
MYWATTTLKVPAGSVGLKEALIAWKEHIAVAHPKVTEVRAYRRNGGTTIIWQEGFANFRDYQDLVEEEDDQCAVVMGNVFKFEIPGTRETGTWSDAF